MSDLRTVSREFLREFISIYRSNPCLWKVKSKEYKDKSKKNIAYDELRVKLSEIDREATKDKVVKKINSLRSCFRKELNKVISSKRSCDGADDVYKPNLWYYEDLLFLTDQELPRKGVSNIYSSEELDTEDFDGSTSDIVTVLQPKTSTSGEGTSWQSFRKKTKTERPSDVLSMVAKNLETSEEGKYSTYGKHIAQELENLSDEMAMYCKRVINEAVFEAQMGTLNRTSRIVTDADNIQQTNKPHRCSCKEELPAAEVTLR